MGSELSIITALSDLLPFCFFDFWVLFMQAGIKYKLDVSNAIYSSETIFWQEWYNTPQFKQNDGIG